jgi:hypothetical protein
MRRWVVAQLERDEVMGGQQTPPTGNPYAGVDPNAIPPNPLRRKLPQQSYADQYQQALNLKPATEPTDEQLFRQDPMAWQRRQSEALTGPKSPLHDPLVRAQNLMELPGKLADPYLRPALTTVLGQRTGGNMATGMETMLGGTVMGLGSGLIAGEAPPEFQEPKPPAAPTKFYDKFTTPLDQDRPAIKYPDGVISKGRVGETHSELIERQRSSIAKQFEKTPDIARRLDQEHFDPQTQYGWVNKNGDFYTKRPTTPFQPLGGGQTKDITPYTGALGPERDMPTGPLESPQTEPAWSDPTKYQMRSRPTGLLPRQGLSSPADAVTNAIADIEKKFPVNPDDPNQRMFMAGGKKALTFEVAENEGVLRLKTMQSVEPGQGVGDLALKRILRVADEHNVPVQLTASPFGEESVGGIARMDKDQLVQWYQKHGFQMEPGSDPALGYMVRPSQGAAPTTRPGSEFAREFARGDEGLYNIDPAVSAAKTTPLGRETGMEWAFEPSTPLQGGPGPGQTGELYPGAYTTPLRSIEEQTGEPRFHGATSGQPIQYMMNPGQGSWGGHLYGAGLYTTDNFDVAHGYGGQGEFPIYNIHEIRPVKMFDVTQQLPANVAYEMFENSGDERWLDYMRPEDRQEYIEHLRHTGRDYHHPLRDIYGSGLQTPVGYEPAMPIEHWYDKARHGMEVASAEEQEAMLRQLLHQEGYGGYSHVGGVRSGGEKHNVKIYWNPKDDIRVRPIDPGDPTGQEFPRYPAPEIPPPYQGRIGEGRARQPAPGSYYNPRFSWDERVNPANPRDSLDQDLMKPEKGYHYQGVDLRDVRDIQEDGLGESFTWTKGPHQRGNLGPWSDALIRVHESASKWELSDENEPFQLEDISPNKIEILTRHGWKPISSIDVPTKGN